MKKVLLIITLLIGSISFAQAPQGINYQAVAYDANGFELSSQNIGVRISIIEGDVFGASNLVEVHSLVTSNQGLFSLQIGQGEKVGGSAETLSDISWGTNTYFLKIELDVENNGSYMDFGTQQFMSVPYALYAESSGSVGPEGPQGIQGEPADPVDYDSLANMISVDSTFLASVSGGGCALKYPDGLYGIAVTQEVNPDIAYEVPSGKRLYVHAWRSYDPVIDGIIVNFINGNPLILNSGESLTSTNTTGTMSSFNGYLIDENILIQAVTEEVNLDIVYEVPSGKRLYIHAWRSYDPVIDGIIVNFINGNPLILNSGEYLQSTNITGSMSSFNGFLVDDSYFANCGFGSSLITSPGLDSVAIATMISDAISSSIAIGVGDYYGGGVVAYIFQPGDAAYVAGETHGYIVNYSNTNDMYWGCGGFVTGINNSSVGQGPVNTQNLVNTCTEDNFAAKYCNDLVVGTYDDWFLPTFQEFSLMPNDVETVIPNITGHTFWISEEVSDGECSYCTSQDVARQVFISGSGVLSLDWGYKTPDHNWGGCRVAAFRQF